LDSAALKDQLVQVQTDVEGGNTLSQAFQKNTTIFSEVQINLLSAGEKSGNMVEVIAQIAVDMEKSHELASKIKSAMIYPIIIFIAIFVVLIILIVFMVPTVESLYKDFNALDKMPDITKFMIKMSNFFSNPIGLIVMVLIVIISIASFKSFTSTEKGKLAMAKLTLKMPVFGNLIQKMQLAQFGRLLSMLLQSGVPIIEALKNVANALSNPVYTKAVMETVDSVAKGVPLAVPIANTGAFPLIYVRMISTGEQTGNLDKVLSDMGKFYEDEVNEITNNLTKLMEPLILLLVGGMVGFLAVAVYLPIYQIGEVIT
jgi:type IV pilus assembly protein PilC